MGIWADPATLIRTSFVLTGVLGLRFDGIPYGNGKTTTVAGMIPIQVACLNQTTPLQVINSFTKVSKQLIPKSYTPSSFNTMSYSKSKDTKEGFVNNRLPDYPDEKPKIQPKLGSQGSSSSTESSAQPGTAANMKSTLGTENTTKKKSSLEGRTVSSCEESSCRLNETCATWIKTDGDSADDNKNSTGTYECILQDLESPLSFSPIIPTSNQLCPEGMTHSVSSGSFRKECRKGVPCPVIWNFTCVDEQNSPHDCSLKKCPLAACVEEMNCLGESRPCIPQTTCIPSYFFPTMTS